MTIWGHSHATHIISGVQEEGIHQHFWFRSFSLCVALNSALSHSDDQLICLFRACYFCCTITIVKLHTLSQYYRIRILKARKIIIVAILILGYANYKLHYILHTVFNKSIVSVVRVIYGYLSIIISYPVSIDGYSVAVFSRQNTLFVISMYRIIFIILMFQLESMIFSLVPHNSFFLQNVWHFLHALCFIMQC